MFIHISLYKFYEDIFIKMFWRRSQKRSRSCSL